MRLGIGGAEVDLVDPGAEQRGGHRQGLVHVAVLELAAHRVKQLRHLRDGGRRAVHRKLRPQRPAVLNAARRRARNGAAQHDDVVARAPAGLETDGEPRVAPRRQNERDVDRAVDERQKGVERGAAVAARRIEGGILQRRRADDDLARLSRGEQLVRQRRPSHRDRRSWSREIWVNERADAFSARFRRKRGGGEHVDDAPLQLRLVAASREAALPAHLLELRHRRRQTTWNAIGLVASPCHDDVGFASADRLAPPTSWIFYSFGR